MESKKQMRQIHSIVENNNLILHSHFVLHTRKNNAWHIFCKISCQNKNYYF